MGCVLLIVMAMVLVMPNCHGIDIRYVSTGCTYHCCAHSHGDGSGNRDDPGEPLILTPYIENNQILKAQELSKVIGIGRYPSYAGYFTVDKQYGSNMFFWFFPAQHGNTSAPVLLWLQGGPGASSLFGLFVENGPLMVDSTGQVLEREVTWNKEHHMIYIDNPVKTGFSFTQVDKGLVTSEEQIAEYLYRTLYQFFQVFPKYQKCPFYITGESYAGKYLPALGYKIHRENPTADMKINLVGVALGDALIDPQNTQCRYSEQLYNLGLTNTEQALYIEQETNRSVALMREKKYVEANIIIDKLVGGVIYPYPVYFANITGVDLTNFERTKDPPIYYTKYINRAEVRKAIHVGSTPYEDGSRDVAQALAADIMAPQAEAFTELLNNNYKVLVYNGQLDLIVGAAPVEYSLLQLDKWVARSEYARASRKKWKINPTDEDVAGYVTQVGRFQRVIVRGGGHLLPADQPERALNMIKNFIAIP